MAPEAQVERAQDDGHGPRPGECAAGQRRSVDRARVGPIPALELVDQPQVGQPGAPPAACARSRRTAASRPGWARGSTGRCGFRPRPPCVPCYAPSPRLGTIRMGDSSRVHEDSEQRLVEVRRERFFVRSQLKVLRRTRERQAAAGTATAASDERLAALERELAELDAAVEGLRARLGRPHR